MRDSLRSRKRIRWERRRVARKSEYNNSETTTKKTFEKSFKTLYIAGFILVSLGLLIAGEFKEPIRQLFHFFTTGTIDTAGQTFSWANWPFVASLVVLKILISLLIITFNKHVLRRKSKVDSEELNSLLRMNPLKIAGILIALVTIEEVIFRWIPLGVLYPLWGTDTALWTLIIGSSILFGLMHLPNQKSGNRSLLGTLPQMSGGLINSYLFLAFGFKAIVITHLLFDLVLFINIKIVYEIQEKKDSQTKAST